MNELLCLEFLHMLVHPIHEVRVPQLLNSDGVDHMQLKVGWSMFEMCP